MPQHPWSIAIASIMSYASPDTLDQPSMDLQEEHDVETEHDPHHKKKRIFKDCFMMLECGSRVSNLAIVWLNRQTNFVCHLWRKGRKEMRRRQDHTSIMILDFEEQ
ncbi:hypothetical protein GUJ93_ZPchr0006g44467 [Zizania palustris]|uniref:Uncharacterized protein n=1 Tax=Zizania palustris TaxID=103762 RepID=A0A8J5VQJ4_ZIZPA|nr:hypothetical protein GUJ93_ZPchr0006g44467 [Zizania palustris]